LHQQSSSSEGSSEGARSEVYAVSNIVKKLEEEVIAAEDRTGCDDAIMCNRMPGAGELELHWQSCMVN
jgi:hypothetical protein